MDDRHLTMEALAKLLTGRLALEEVVGHVVPHFLTRCPECQEIAAGLAELKARVGHWDELVAYEEGLVAPEQLAHLRSLPYEEQIRRAREDESLHAWGLCALLIDESRRAVLSQPATAVDLAAIAVRVVDHLGEAYDPAWVADLGARALTALGNARRVLGELRSADDAFEDALARLSGGTGDPRIEAEVLDFGASLRRDQRRLDEASALLGRVLSAYREIGDAHLEGRALVTQALTATEKGHPEDAISLLRKAESLLDKARDPRLLFVLKHNLLDNLRRVGRAEEARALLAEAEELAQMAEGTDRLRLRWTAGLIDHDLGLRDPAEAAFREVMTAFFDKRMAYDAALVALDLAVLYAEHGEVAALKRLAAEVTPVFASREVQREALMAVLLFQHACEHELLTVRIARHCSAMLKRSRRVLVEPLA